MKIMEKGKIYRAELTGHPFVFLDYLNSKGTEFYAVFITHNSYYEENYEFPSSFIEYIKDDKKPGKTSFFCRRKLMKHIGEIGKITEYGKLTESGYKTILKSVKDLPVKEFKTKKDSY